jgi:DNA-binding winged helix-turn-helix (wHTH) protein
MDKEVIGYKFGNYTINLSTRKLSFAREDIQLSERNYLFLCILAKASPELVTKEELLKQLWPDRIVSDWALARLISDTRLLLDDNGEQQHLIKTARGIGYSLTTSKTIYSADQEQLKNNQKRSLKKLSFAVIAFIILSIIGFQINNTLNQQQLYKNIAYIAKHQNSTFTHFMAQVARRNELVAMIETRLNIKKTRQFEKFFAHYYPQMNKEELFVFEQVRAITDSGLYPSNKAIFETLEQDNRIFKEIPKTKALSEHLKFWLNKYQGIFQQRKDMCLVYVGVEDGVPYPKGVDQAVKKWLQENSPNQK